MSAEVAVVLRSAADILRRDGWRQGSMGVAGRAACLREAVCRAQGAKPYYGRLARNALAAATGDFRIPDWNDEPGRTIDEVLDLLERVAVDEEQVA